MRLRNLFLLLPFSTALLLGGCSQDAAINKVVSASPKVLRDCDRLGMKVLLASYEKAGENQGRFISFQSNSLIPVSGKWSAEYKLIKKGSRWVDSFGEAYNYTLVYYVDDEGNPRVYVNQDTPKNPPDEKFTSFPINPIARINLFNGRDSREKSKTKDSLTCELELKGEGSMQNPYDPTDDTYIVSGDSTGIYWRED